MKLIDKVKEALEMGLSKIEIRGEISGGQMICLTITDFLGRPIKLGTSLNKAEVRIQPLILKDKMLTEGDNRIDNCHDGLHQHSTGSILSISGATVSAAFLALWGEDYKVLENQPFSN